MACQYKLTGGVLVLACSGMRHIEGRHVQQDDNISGRYSNEQHRVVLLAAWVSVKLVRHNIK